MASTYNPRAIRRCVRFDFAGPDGVLAFKSKSMTRSGDEVLHHPAICLKTGAVTCTCEHYSYRLAKHHPTLSTPDFWCKHLAACIANLKRKGFAL